MFNSNHREEYIERWALFEKMKADCNPKSYPRATAKDVFTCAIANVEVFPASPVMPIVYVQWEPVENIAGDVFRCSNCGTENHVKTVMGNPDWKFCPECGAKMTRE